MFQKFLRFEDIIYPVWRRKVPTLLKHLTDPLYKAFYPVDIDLQAPEDALTMAQYLVDWDIMPHSGIASLADELERCAAPISVLTSSAKAEAYTGAPVRIPAQWEQMERILMSWGRMYPQVWDMHAQMVEALSQVVRVEILVPTDLWARAIAVYLDWRGKAKTANLEFLILPTNDIWIRDYGPIMGISPTGQKVAVNAIYDVLPHYPQAADNAMTEHWAAQHHIPVMPLNLHTEGGNLWSDGQGTLLMSSQLFFSNRYYTRDTVLEYLHTVFDFQKAIITPRLSLEETGHIDLLVKLANPNTVFVSAATSFTTEEALRKCKRLFQRETNAKGESYEVIELPTPPLYLNWFSYTVRRSYTNALTVNGRVLVPTFKIPEDELALKLYEKHMPDFEIIPIDSSIGIHGGGAVHCMTKEVPMV